MFVGVRHKRGFTLVELLVVIGIISVLISMLMPAMARARAQANWVKCESNLKPIGLYLQSYVNDSKGWMFPPGLGYGLPRDKRWPMYVFKPPIWNPPVMLCPSDLEPLEEHSYLLNDHLVEHKVRAFSKNLGGQSTGEVIVVGEKRSDYPDYYMNRNDYPTRVEPYRHGLQQGSNYLFMDWHVASLFRNASIAGIDPWDVPTSQPANP